MQTVTKEHDTLVSTQRSMQVIWLSDLGGQLGARPSYRYLFNTLPELGLSCLTNVRVEQVICTSSLTAHL